MFGKDHSRERPGARGAERVRSLLEFRIELLEDWLDRSDDERQRHEHERKDDRRPRERDVDADR